MPGDGDNGKVPPLRSIYYNPVGGCNLHCRHCWVDPDVDRPGRGPFEQRDRRDDELTPEEFFGTLDDATALGLKEVKFTGGEPFLRNDTIDLIQGAAERGLGITIETNGTLLSEGLVGLLSRVRPKLVAVSLDHVDPAEHDRFRGVKGAHARALSAIKLLVSKGRRVQIIAAITKKTQEHAGAMVAFARQLGVHSIKLCPVVPVGRGASVHEQGDGLSVRELLAVYKQHANITGAGTKVCVEVPPAFRPLREFKAIRLCQIKGQLGLLANGDLSYCGIGMTHPELVMGNVRQVRLEALWRDHPLLHAVRRDLPDALEGVCARCMLKAFCLGFCRVLEYVRTGRFLAANWFCAQAEEQGFFPANRLVRCACANSALGARDGSVRRLDDAVPERVQAPEGD